MIFLILSGSCGYVPGTDIKPSYEDFASSKLGTAIPIIAS